GLKEKIEKLSENPGVYIFKDENENILYIGKAKNLKKRVKQYFQRRQKWIWDFINNISDIDFFECENEKEAMLLEAGLIKKYQPKFNIEWRDDKNYFYVGITNEDFPRVFWTHQINKFQIPSTKFQTNSKFKIQNSKFDYFGPYVKGSELKKFLAEIRRILPFRTCKSLSKKPCLYYHLEVCPAPCKNKRQKKKYQKLIETLKVLLKVYLGENVRIEGYDISNISGSLTVGSMIVFEKQKPKKSDYRRFKIKRVKGQNDVKSLREVLLRRMKHIEWKMPDLILLDGGKGQLKAGEKIDIPILALAKRGKHSGRLYSPFSKNFVLLDDLPEEFRNFLLKIRDEAHRFAVAYHKLRRKKALRL
ncbi:MAG: GIY-YIG nuclease family protein, partial [Candidatus Pacebacteria bacterium]|nr:GIY-YIG nuclease family protein [Candidatus Paceibacterota bacterium]